MGIAFSRIISVFSKQLTVGTQTSTKFTEKLTNFGTVELSSAETFDQACNICDLYTEKEAVGFCCVCEQYMCYQCCKHHEKIYQSKNHKIVGKEDFENVRTRKELFDMHLVPLTSGRLPKCIYSSCTKYNMYYHCTYLLSRFPVGTDIYFVLGSSCNTNLEIGCTTEKANFKIIHTNKSTKNLANKNATAKYFVKAEEIWLLTYHNNYVSYEQVFTVTGRCDAVVRFNNGLAICIYIQTGFSLPNWQIQYVDFKGNIKKQIYYDSDGKPLFKYPIDIASNFTEDILFVSDYEHHAVIALGTKGEVIYKFTQKTQNNFDQDTIQYPAGLTCDEENNVYVACGQKVIQIDKHGKKSRVILRSQSKNIANLCYNRQSRRLAVIDSDNNFNSVTIFTFD